MFMLPNDITNQADQHKVLASTLYSPCKQSGLKGTHHYIICFVRPLHSKPGTESYC